ncbi:MAG TPA: integrase domain-containing protein [Xanthobacteraceae bacterium]|nr:integrase domain-containing protein [Xanthobacteraceae bacterium]
MSAKTMQERETFLFAFFRELRRNEDKCYRVDPRRLGNRHIRFMVKRWLGRGLAPATIQLYMSFLRTFSNWIGKPELALDLERYIDDPQRYQRSYCALEDKSWSAHGVDAERMFEAMSAIDRYAAAQLAMKAAFGLRRKEALMLQPHRQVVTAREARIEDAPCEFYLDLLKGTKGGRRRYLPIDTERKRLALARACAVARGPNDHLGHPGRTLKQNLRRVDYVMAKLGVTHQALGITGHGLRHEYANDLYEKESGAAPPLRGGSEVSRSLDRDARLKVAHDLGHGRVEVSGAYLGGLLKARSSASESDSKA